MDVIAKVGFGDELSQQKDDGLGLCVGPCDPDTGKEEQLDQLVYVFTNKTQGSKVDRWEQLKDGV